MVGLYGIACICSLLADRERDQPLSFRFRKL